MLDPLILEMLDDLEEVPNETLPDCLTSHLKGHYGLPADVPLDLS